MKKVYLIHGYQGEPNGGWRPWLMGELAREGIWACALAMPTPAHPLRDVWVKTIRESIDVPISDVILVGHSLGGPAITYFLATLGKDERVGGVVYVASPSDITRDGIDSELQVFLSKPQNLAEVRDHVVSGRIIHGDNDSVVPKEHAERMKEVFGFPLLYIKNGGHLGSIDKCYKLPEVLDAVLQLTTVN